MESNENIPHHRTWDLTRWTKTKGTVIALNKLETNLGRIVNAVTILK